MKKHDVIVSFKLPMTLKSQLEEEAKQKGIDLSKLIRMRMRHVHAIDGQDIPSVTLQGHKTLTQKRCPKCGGLFTPKYDSQLMCCNMCSAHGLCDCGAAKRQKLLII